MIWSATTFAVFDICPNESIQENKNTCNNGGSNSSSKYTGEPNSNVPRGDVCLFECVHHLNDSAHKHDEAAEVNQAEDRCDTKEDRRDWSNCVPEEFFHELFYIP